MEFLSTLFSITLFGGVFWGLIAFILFVFFCFVADVNRNGFVATGFFLVIGSLFYFFGRESFNWFASFITWKFTLFYLSTGLFYAFVRVFFHGRNEKKIYNLRRSNPDYLLDYKMDRDIKEDFFRWWFLWSVSLINWIISDIIRDIYDWFYQKISKILNFIMDLGAKSVGDVEYVYENRNKKKE